jgi:DNA-binding SARP family transcriptional activator/WD40 repeat protein/energy-coupling factor transporter ATP-binding protein EcfA2
VDFCLLGPLEVSDGNGPVRFGEGRQRSVLVLLLLHRNEAIASERLIDVLWGEAPPATAAKVLQNYVGQLRRALGDREGGRLQTRGRGYALRVEDGELDVDRFERLVREGGEALERQRPADAAARLREALALWRGPPLADVAYESFAQPEIARLEEERTAALERRIDADLALGRHADLVAELEALVAQHPLRERLRGQRMLALYRCGRQAEALEAYREARRLLIEEVGVEPGPELRGLQEAVLRQDVSLELEPGELPRELDAGAAPVLVGREREIEWLRERWDRARYGAGALVVVIGERGMGKTRLAAELAGEVHRAGSRVLYATGSAEPLVAIHRARDASVQTLLVVDDLDASESALAVLAELALELPTKPVLAVVAAERLDRPGRLGAVESLALGPLDADAVRRIALFYAPDGAAGEVPVVELLGVSGGVPGEVHEAASAWASREAARRVVAFAPRAAAGRSELRAAEVGLAGGVVDLQAARERGDRLAADEAPVVCPFKGLAPFECADARYFFGRERLTAELVARAVGAPLLGVVGPSGSGKSSVVKAGLLPALAAGVLPGSDSWPQAIVRPGEHPMRELRSASGERAADEHIVLVVDQFEEVFTACRDEQERAAFIDALVRTAHRRDDEGLVVLAVRADFYGRCATYPELAKLLGANHVLVGPMQPDELRRAIEQPAQRVGLQVEPELVDELIADVEDEPGALPLLSSALLELWQRRDGRRLRHATYERTGGVRGAVARLAEAAFSELDPGQQRIARSLLLRLAGEGAGGTVVRRRVALTELEGHSDEDLEAVLGALTDRRLLTMSATTVEVAHEALLREWPRLRGWLEEDAQGRRVQRHLADAARDWDERGRDPGDLYRGARLAVALEWRASHEHELNPTERAFLDAGRAAAGRAQRRLRIVLAGIAALLAVAVAGALIAVHQRSAARSEALAAEAQRIGAQALTDPDLDRSLLLARQGVAVDDAPATRSNLLATLVRAPAAIAVMHAAGNPLTAIDVDPDGRTLAVGDSRGTVLFLDAITRRRIGPPVKVGLVITAVRFSPDGTRVAVAGHDVDQFGFVELFDARTHRNLRRLATGFESSALVAFVAQVGSIVFSPDSRVLVADILAAGRRSNTRRYAVRWDAATGRRLGVPRPLTSGATGTPCVMGFGAGGTQLVTFSPGHGSTVVRDAVTLRQTREFRGGGSPAAVSANGRIAAFALPDGSARLVDLRTGSVRTISRRNGAPVVAMRFTPDSRKLVTAAGNAPLVVWDVKHATPVETFTGLGTVEQLTVASDGRTVCGVGHDDSVIAWDLTGTRRFGRAFRVDPPTATGVLAVTARGSTFAVPDRGGYVDLRNSRELSYTRRARISAAGAPRGASTLVSIAPDGRTLATATADGAIGFIDLRSGRPLAPPVLAHVGKVLALAFSNDGRWLATGGTDDAVYLWDVRRRRPVSISSALTGPPTSLSISPDGSKVAATVVGPDGNGLLDVLSMPRLALAAHRPAIAGRQTQFSRDGRLLFYGDDAGRVWALDTRTWKPRGPPFAGHAAPGRFALSPDDRVLATTAADGSTQLWQIPSGRPIGTPLPGVAGQRVSAAFIEGGAELVTLHDNGQGYVWDLRPWAWARRACAIAGRALTRTEWHDALPERHYLPACSAR